MPFFINSRDGVLMEQGAEPTSLWQYPPEGAVKFETRWEAEAFVDDNLDLDLEIEECQ